MKEPGKSPYAAMTVNERLGTAGLFEEWDAAVLARDRARMIAVLEKVDVGPGTADAVLANPAKYGF